MAKNCLLVLGNWYWKTADRYRWYLHLSMVQGHFSSFLTFHALCSQMILASIKRKANEWRKHTIIEIQGSYLKIFASAPSFTLSLLSLTSSSIPITLHVIFFQGFYILTSSVLALCRFSDCVYHCIEIHYYLALSAVSNVWQTVFVLLPFPQRQKWVLESFVLKTHIH